MDGWKEGDAPIPLGFGDHPLTWKFHRVTPKQNNPSCRCEADHCVNFAVNYTAPNCFVNFAENSVDFLVVASLSIAKNTTYRGHLSQAASQLSQCRGATPPAGGCVAGGCEAS